MREWRNRQTRTVQVRVPVMEWGFNSPLAHDETADPSGSAVFVFPGCGGGVVAPVFSCCLWSHGCSVGAGRERERVARHRPVARGRRWPRRGRLRALRVRPLGCGSRGDLEGPQDADVAELAQEVIAPHEGKRAQRVRQPRQLDIRSAAAV